MPQMSRYSDETVENLMEELCVALEKNKASTDLSLMVLGNLVSNIFINNVAAGDREQMLEKFCEILKRSSKG